MASIMASPRNSAGVQGIAWKANLYSVQFNNGVFEVSGTDAYQAISDAIIFGSSVVTMAWSALSNHTAIANLIRDAHLYNDVVFVGAAGTSYAGFSQNNVVFPAELPEVLAASAANFNGMRDNASHYGPELDIVVHQPTTSVGATGGSLSNSANSSSATGFVGGVAALVRSRYPAWTNSQVESRIINTAGLACGVGTAFGPIINAEAAVGGICVPFGRPVGPQSIPFGHVAAGDTRTSQTAQYCTYPSGGSAAIEITWGDGSHGNCRMVTFSRGQYTTYVSVQVRDTGVALAARTFVIQVQVEDLDISCPTCF